VLLVEVGPAGLHAPPWRAAYAALAHRRLDRVTRHFGWRLLHGALRCGAVSVPWCAAGSLEELRHEVCCQEPCCARAVTLPAGGLVPALADFTHTFIACPAVRPALDWLRALWARLAPEDGPVPLDARVLLLGDVSVWSPRGGEGPAGLWLHLRLLFCRAVWVTAVRARAGGGLAEGWRQVVAMTVAWVSRAIRQDWLRVGAALPGAAVLPSWCVIDKRFQLTQGQFEDRWCLNGVLASVDCAAAGGARLTVHVPGGGGPLVPRSGGA
jgi:hypothetical protein